MLLLEPGTPRNIEAVLLYVILIAVWPLCLAVLLFGLRKQCMNIIDAFTHDGKSNNLKICLL